MRGKPFQRPERRTLLEKSREGQSFSAGASATVEKVPLEEGIRRDF